MGSKVYLQKSLIIVVVYEFVEGLIEVTLGRATLLLSLGFSFINRFFGLADFINSKHLPLVINSNNLVNFFVSNKFYIGGLLLLIGLVKMISAIALLFGRLWGYYILIIITAAFIPFDLLNLRGGFNFVKIFTIFINLLILYLLIFSFRKHQKSIGN